MDRHPASAGAIEHLNHHLEPWVAIVEPVFDDEPVALEDVHREPLADVWDDEVEVSVLPGLPAQQCVHRPATKDPRPQVRGAQLAEDLDDVARTYVRCSDPSAGALEHRDAEHRGGGRPRDRPVHRAQPAPKRRGRDRTPSHRGATVGPMGPDYLAAAPVHAAGR